MPSSARSSPVANHPSPMQRFSRKCFAGFIAVALCYIVLNGVGAYITGTMTAAEMAENEKWIASGKLWTDRQMCRWLGICGLFHYLNKSAWTSQHIADDIPKPTPQWSDYWISAKTQTIGRMKSVSCGRFPKELEDDRNLTNLNDLNGVDGGVSGKYIYLQSNDNVEERPRWLGGNKNIPHAPEMRKDIGFDAPWPDLGDLKDFDLEKAQQQVLKEQGDSAESQNAVSASPTILRVTEDGRCGGNSGLTCEGSKYGQCCSIYGIAAMMLLTAATLAILWLANALILWHPNLIATSRSASTTWTGRSIALRKADAAVPPQSS
ncbi:hypothetical protein L1887_63313 [Cichorium endivia]|nr:hypothetical protein L1887_63313 [Cichorium endivia]